MPRLYYGEALNRTGSECIEKISPSEASILVTEALVKQGASKLSKRIMCGRVAVQAPKRGGQPATSGGCCLQKKSCGLRDDPAQMYVITYSRLWINRVKVTNPARGQLTRENEYSPVPVRA